MKAGTTPLVVQVPETAPMKRRITRATTTSAMFSFMPFSKAFHGVLNSHMDSAMATPADTSSATWLAPRIESLLNMLTLRDSSRVSTMIGMEETRSLAEGLRVICRFVLQLDLQVMSFFPFLVQETGCRRILYYVLRIIVQEYAVAFQKKPLRSGGPHAGRPAALFILSVGR